MEMKTERRTDAFRRICHMMDRYAQEHPEMRLNEKRPEVGVETLASIEKKARTRQPLGTRTGQAWAWARRWNKPLLEAAEKFEVPYGRLKVYNRRRKRGSA